MFDFPEKEGKRNRNSFIHIADGGDQVQFLAKLFYGIKVCLVILYASPILIC